MHHAVLDLEQDCFRSKRQAGSDQSTARDCGRYPRRKAVDGYHDARRACVRDARMPVNGATARLANAFGGATGLCEQGIRAGPLARAPGHKHHAPALRGPEWEQLKSGRDSSILRQDQAGRVMATMPSAPPDNYCQHQNFWRDTRTHVHPQYFLVLMITMFAPRFAIGIGPNRMGPYKSVMKKTRFYRGLAVPPRYAQANCPCPPRRQLEGSIRGDPALGDRGGDALKHRDRGSPAEPCRGVGAAEREWCKQPMVVARAA